MRKRWWAADRTILTHALYGLRKVMSSGDSSPLTYAQNAIVGILGLIMLIGITPDAVMRHLVVPHAFQWVNWIVDAAELWATLWVCGLYGTMAALPHQINSDRILFRAGALGQVEIGRDAILDAVPMPVEISARMLKRKNRNAGFLCVPGARIVRVDLNAPVVIHKYPFAAAMETQTLYVSSDRPSELCAALTSGSTGTPSARTALIADNETPAVL